MQTNHQKWERLNMDNKYKTREQWLTAADSLLNEHVFNSVGITDIPTNVVYSCSFATTGNKEGAKHVTWGQIFSPEMSNDKVNFQIVISPLVEKPIEVLATQAHEIIHKNVGLACGHKGPFVRMMKAIGLEGKPTATKAGDKLTEKLQIIADKLGPYPHSKLNTTGRKKQTTRMHKCQCSECGYTVRLSQKWLDVGTPICTFQEHGPMEVAD